MEDYTEISLDEVKKYLDDLRPRAHPFFCECCPIIRGTPDMKKTYINEWEELLYRSRGMCSKCFQYLNHHSGEQALEDRIKLWENSTNLTIKRV